MNDETSSNSGFLIPAEDHSSAQFTDFVELPCKGFNVIFKAKKYGKWHILKGLKSDLRNQTVYRELLRKEFTIGVGLNHANIANVIGFEENEQIGPCIVMEYVDGVTLADFLKEKQSIKVCAKLLDEILSAIIYFHGKQIIHRDLKPSNIMVTHNGHNIKVIDFGLADADSYAYLKQPAGTLSYAAPEQLQEGALVDARTDIYALGKILELDFPHRFRWLARKCAKQFPECRPDNAKSIVKLIQRRKVTFWILIICNSVFLLFFMLMWIIDINSTYQIQQNTVQSENVESEKSEYRQFGAESFSEMNEKENSASSEVKVSTLSTDAGKSEENSTAEYQEKAKQLDRAMEDFYHPLITQLEKRQFQWVEESEYEFYNEKGKYHIQRAREQVWQPLKKTITDEDLSMELWKHFDYLWRKYFDEISALQRITPRYSDAKKAIQKLYDGHEISQEEYERKIDSLGPQPRNFWE